MPERWSRHLGYTVLALLGLVLLGVVLRTPSPASGVARPLDTPGTDYLPVMFKPEPSPTPTATPTGTSTPTPTATSTHTATPSPTQPCGQAIENGDFEQGHVAWTEDSSGLYELITIHGDAWQGDWIAWLAGYYEADDRIYQRIHIPEEAADSQSLTFWLQVELGFNASPSDTLYLQFFDASWNAASNPELIAGGSAAMSWTPYTVTLYGFSGFAGQDLYIQFRGTTDDDNNMTNFFLDVVSLEIVCGPAAMPQPERPWIRMVQP